MILPLLLYFIPLSSSSLQNSHWKGYFLGKIIWNLNRWGAYQPLTFSSFVCKVEIL